MWISTIGTWRCAASTPTATRSARGERIDIDLTGGAPRRDAQVRHAITRLLHHTHRHGIAAIAVEDLDFADARTTGRETTGRGQRGKRFRRTVSGLPTAVFCNRITGMAQHTGIAVYAVNPAYTSTWGAQPWQRPYINVTRHQAAATVIGRRAQGHPARRRKGVTPKRPEDRPVRATNQTGPDNPQATTGTATGQGCEEPNLARQAAGVRGHPSRATVTPAQLANNDQLQLQRF